MIFLRQIKIKRVRFDVFYVIMATLIMIVYVYAAVTSRLCWAGGLGLGAGWAWPLQTHSEHDATTAAILYYSFEHVHFHLRIIAKNNYHLWQEYPQFFNYGAGQGFYPTFAGPLGQQKNNYHLLGEYSHVFNCGGGQGFALPLLVHDVSNRYLYEPP